MTKLLVAGATPPEARLIGWQPNVLVPQVGGVGLPVPPLSAGDAGNLVFEFLKKARDAKLDPLSLIDLSGAAGDIGALPGIGVWYNWYQTKRWDIATVYLLAFYATNGGADPLPEDQLGNLGTKPGWPDPGDDLEQQVYGWALKHVGWDGDVPHYELRKTLQVQKWSKKESKWKVLQRGEGLGAQDLTFEQDPITRVWGAGIDLGEWLNEHGKDIFTAINTIFAAVAAFTGYGAIIFGIQQAFKALALAAAKGDWGQIWVAIQKAGAAMAQLPGVAEFGEALEGAAVDTLAEVFAGPVAKSALTSVLDAKGEVDKIVAKAEEMRKTVTGTVDEIKAHAMHLRETLVPEPLKPWFDKAFANAQAKKPTSTFGPAHPVPYYAKGTWDFAIALGTVAQEPPRVAPGFVSTFGADRKAADDLITFVRQLEKRYGVTQERDFTLLSRTIRKEDVIASGHTVEEYKAWGWIVV